MIIGEIRRYLRDNKPIRVSRSVRDLAYRALQLSLIHIYMVRETERAEKSLEEYREKQVRIMRFLLA